MTTFQLDIKCNGLTFQTLEKALQQVGGYVGMFRDFVVCQPGPCASFWYGALIITTTTVTN